MQNKSKTQAAPFIFRILLYLLMTMNYSKCSSGLLDSTETTDANVDITVAEEKIQNPLFYGKKSIRIFSPSHESVKTLKTLTFKLSNCDYHQKYVISSDRLLTTGNSVANPDVIVGSFVTVHEEQNTVDAYGYPITIATPETTFDQTVFTGDNGSPINLTAGRWYVTSWSYDADGEMTCSSPQYSFIIR